MNLYSFILKKVWCAVTLYWLRIDYPIPMVMKCLKKKEKKCYMLMISSWGSDLEVATFWIDYQRCVLDLWNRKNRKKSVTYLWSAAEVVTLNRFSKVCLEPVKQVCFGGGHSSGQTIYTWSWCQFHCLVGVSWCQLVSVSLVLVSVSLEAVLCGVILYFAFSHPEICKSINLSRISIMLQDDSKVLKHLILLSEKNNWN